MKISYEIVRQGGCSVEVFKITHRQYYNLIQSVCVVKEDKKLADMVLEFFLAMCEKNNFELNFKGVA